MRQKAEAIRYAESCRSPWASDHEIDALCEQMPLSSGLVDEAYARSGASVDASTLIRVPRRDLPLVAAGPRSAFAVGENCRSPSTVYREGIRHAGSLIASVCGARPRGLLVVVTVEPRGVVPPTSRVRSHFRVLRVPSGARNCPGMQRLEPRLGGARGHSRAAEQGQNKDS